MTKQPESDPVDAIVSLLREPAPDIKKLEAGRLTIAERKLELKRFLDQGPALEDRIVNTTSPIAMRSAKLAELSDQRKDATNALRILEAPQAQLDAAIERRRREDEGRAQAAEHETAVKLQKAASASWRAPVEKAQAIVADALDIMRPAEGAINRANRARPDGAPAILPADADRYPIPARPTRAVRTLVKLWCREDGGMVRLDHQDQILDTGRGWGQWEDNPPGVTRAYTNTRDRFVRRDFVRTQWIESFTGYPPNRSAATILAEIAELFDELLVRGAIEIEERPGKLEYAPATAADRHLHREGELPALAAE
jgi:hypothetical protein